MKIYVPSRLWKIKGPRSVSAKIRQRKSKKVRPARKGEVK